MWSSYKVEEQIHITEFFSFFEVEYKQNYTFSGETHNFWECLYVMEGSLCVSGDERVYNLGNNDIIFHKPMELHKFKVESKKAKLLIFSFSAEGELVKFLKNKVFHLNEEQQGILNFTLDFVRRKSGESNDEEKKTADEYLVQFDKIKTYSHMVSTFICQLALTLCDDNSIAIVSSSESALIFKNAVNLMNNNINKNLHVCEIARLCNISETGLKRIFHKYAGLGIHKYYLKMKIKTASEMLEDGMNVSDISDKLGFGSQAYFSAVFKRETGICPTDFKRGI